MKVLLIDTSSRKVRLEVYKDQFLLKGEDWEGDMELSQKIFEYLEKLLDGERVDGILCVKGPGSFTSIRIGVVAANSLALAWEVPIVGIESGDEKSGLERLERGEDEKVVEPVYDREPDIK